MRARGRPPRRVARWRPPRRAVPGCDRSRRLGRVRCRAGRSLRCRAGVGRAVRGVGRTRFPAPTVPDGIVPDGIARGGIARGGLVRDRSVRDGGGVWWAEAGRADVRIEDRGDTTPTSCRVEHRGDPMRHPTARARRSRFGEFRSTPRLEAGSRRPGRRRAGRTRRRLESDRERRSNVEGREGRSWSCGGNPLGGDDEVGFGSFRGRAVQGR